MSEVLTVRSKRVAKEIPAIWKANQDLCKACSEAGPLNGRERRLVKIALAVGGGSEGAVHSHARRAVDEGLSPEELRHVAALTITTLGFPRAIAALTWIDDIVSRRDAG